MSDEFEAACSDEVALLLPWYVTEKLSAQQMRQVTTHLQHCATCRADVERERQIATLMQADAVIELAPQPGLQKLLARTTTSAITRSSGGHSYRLTPGPMRWLAAAVLVQTIGLGWLAGMLWLRPDNAPASYRTLTSPSPAHAAGQIRAMFTAQTSLQELGTLLHASALSIVAGPSESGLYTLSIAPANSQVQTEKAVSSTVATLRGDPHVVFVEPVSIE